MFTEKKLDLIIYLNKRVRSYYINIYNYRFVKYNEIIF